MALILEAQFPRTLDALVARITREAQPGEAVEAWVFEDVAARRAAEDALAARDVTAKIRSAYKPLLHALLDEAQVAGLSAVTVKVPVHEAAAKGRFQLETYPLAGLLGGATLAFAPGEAGLTYEATLDYADGARAERLRVFAPNRLRADHLGRQVLAPCGWLRITPPGNTEPRLDEAVETEFEALFDAAMAAIAAHPWSDEAPHFEELLIEAEIPFIARPLAYHDEVIDTREALHEEFYFSLLELFQQRAGLPLGARNLRPGQIIPDIRGRQGDARLRVASLPFARDADPIEGAQEPLEHAEKPLSPEQVMGELAALGGRPLLGHSRAGRSVAGTIIDGAGPPVVVTGGQHANETTGIVGSLRAARRLKEAGRAFALIPVENPDGYALHHRLRRTNPRHMHHAARYTAQGNDLEAQEAGALMEKAVRLKACEATGARLHINLHGYPAHEWTRPLTGYLPRTFELWAVPKGFFLILRHHKGLAEVARDFIEKLTARLAAELPQMIAFNAEQIETYRKHVGSLPFAVINGIPCSIDESDRSTVPFVLITEYPDETIYGDAFRLGHTTQMHSVLAAADLAAMLDPSA